ncbi:hypothetical protein GJA_186 [Janthinobacterium agaricidamnosum NBRC 102515 = DSM 9628]|uniref:Uncharacterized protein n=1 Tax=Janthinobacterium agaricidamnosum NBRC 102515 = DSM 9628 TaxID=1349767 RepID=W0UWP9_9BURK|nr:hypothetical protein GJA_186 [Janthinobacterium agaricidamnosum NBRC 102515 = DSM 9628]
MSPASFSRGTLVSRLFLCVSALCSTLHQGKGKIRHEDE